MKKEKIKFSSLSKDMQNKIRREYRDTCHLDYQYSINLFIIYVILGIICLSGILLICFKYYLEGSLIFSLSFVFMIIDLYFLYLSNLNFYKFLKKKKMVK